uniref:Uncharacterized protein n=1 Tax=Solanum tuberosum TaxID=4113 RepID=Q94QI0_SOLTU|nr:unknown [Solanum tuberosum]
MTFALHLNTKQNLLARAYNKEEDLAGYSLFLIAQEREIPESLDFTATHLSNIFFLLQERKEHHIIGYTIRKHRSSSTC